MAVLAKPQLSFLGGCPDCGERSARLPAPLPDVADDFDWTVRDYDSFRLFMMEELAHRFPSRRRWTSADMEVVIVELLSAALDRASGALDAIFAEGFLETARQPSSVRRLLELIGYDAVAKVDADELKALPPSDSDDDPEDEPGRRLERYWELNPEAMAAARLNGPRQVRAQERMVTLPDHVTRLEKHPLVTRASARLVWNGAWRTILCAVQLNLPGDAHLDEKLALTGTGPRNAKLWEAILRFHKEQNLPAPAQGATSRAILMPLVEARRMVGSEVILEDAKLVPLSLALSVRARPGFYRSELKQALAQVLAPEADGLFARGKLGFGEDVFASDIIEVAMAVDGVETVCINLFRRMDGPDCKDLGVIAIAPDEIAILLNIPGHPENGAFRITINGGVVG